MHANTKPLSTGFNSPQAPLPTPPAFAICFDPWESSVGSRRTQIHQSAGFADVLSFLDSRLIACHEAEVEASWESNPPELNKQKQYLFRSFSANGQMLSCCLSSPAALFHGSVARPSLDGATSRSDRKKNAPNIDSKLAKHEAAIPGSVQESGRQSKLGKSGQPSAVLNVA